MTLKNDINNKHVPKRHYEQLHKNDRFSFSVPIDQVTKHLPYTRLDGTCVDQNHDFSDPFSENEYEVNLKKLIKALNISRERILSEKQQTAISLYYDQGKTYKEASNAMGNNSPESTRKLLSNAYTRIQEHFKANPELYKLLEKCGFKTEKCSTSEAQQMSPQHKKVEFKRIYMRHPNRRNRSKQVSPTQPK